jgi:hypothetical protein
LHPDDEWVLGDWKPVGYLDGLLESNVLWDSDVGNGEENEDMEEEESGVDVNEDSQNDDNDFDEEEYYYKNDSDDYDDDGYKRGINNRLNGKQLYPNHYIDRYLPGVLESHPYGNRPTNAIGWNYSPDRQGWGEGWKYIIKSFRGHIREMM